MTHFDDESLFEYVEGTSPVAGEIESHVSSCGDCAEEVGEQREMIAALADGAVWETAPPAPPTAQQFLSSAATFTERLRAEDEEAIALCDEILTGPSSWWPQRLRNAPRALTAGMVKQLLERVGEARERSPANALQLTTLAMTVANALDVSAYPCDFVIKLRAQATREHAQALSFVGRVPEALECIDRAKRLFEQVPLPEYDLARVGIVKSLILQYVDRFPEAIAIAREAGDTFLRFGDRVRYVNARITEGAVVYSSGAVDRALEIWKSVENDSGLDQVGAVRLAHNIALGLSESNQPAAAVEYIVRCIGQFDMLGMHTERTRSRWLLAHALVAAGKAEEAIPTLRATWGEFEQLDMIADAGLVALELAEVLLTTGRSQEVPAICRELIAQFTRAGMASRAITALSFLREAVALGQASTSLVRHVHAFLRELPNEQPRLFAPPPVGAGE